VDTHDSVIGGDRLPVTAPKRFRAVNAPAPVEADEKSNVRST